MKKVFISGPISSLSYEEAYLNFYHAEKKLLKITGKIYNPTKLCNKDWSWLRCVIVCLYYLIFKANAIYVLRNWQKSKGSKVEIFTALLLNKKFITVEGN